MIIDGYHLPQNCWKYFDFRQFFDVGSKYVKMNDWKQNTQESPQPTCIMYHKWIKIGPMLLASVRLMPRSGQEKNDGKDDAFLEREAGILCRVFFTKCKENFMIWFQSGVSLSTKIIHSGNY